MKIAVIGSGITGISASWLLSKQHEVHLFEKETRLGGHTYTLSLSDGEKLVPVDCGFLVHNDRTYPELIAMLKYLQLKTHATEMSLSIQVEEKNIEWCGSNLKTLMMNKKAIFNIKYWKMLSAILQFHKKKFQHIENCQKNKWTLGEFIHQEKLNQEFVDWYLLPMGGCIWSCSTQQMLEFPAYTFLSFCENHGLLQTSDRPKWRTIPGGNFQYIEALRKEITNVHQNEEVLECYRHSSTVDIKTTKRKESFDLVVFACHTPDICRILKDQSPDEKNILEKFHYQKNKIYIHSDESYLPSAKRNWSSWNFFTQKINELNHICVTYWINLLQPLNTKKNFFVTLNPSTKPSHIHQELDFDHPLFDQAAIEAQQKLDKIQGLHRTYFAGAWCGHGFHEDGLVASLKVCKKIGVEAPW